VIAPEPSLVTLVSGRDDTPEGAGIFRVFGDRDQSAGSASPEATADKPLPPKAGKTRAKTGSAAAAPATQSASLAHSTDGLSSGR
jgi:hypothetical protein